LRIQGLGLVFSLFKSAGNSSSARIRHALTRRGRSTLSARPFPLTQAALRASVLMVGTLLAGCAAAPLPATAPLGLEGTRWQLAVVNSMDDAQPPLRPADPARYTIEFTVDRRLLVQLDCNRGHATWTAEAAPDASAQRRSGSLMFGPLATTRMICPPGSLEPRLAAIFPYVRSFVIENGQLHLALLADGGILSWNPVAADRATR
jgi:heat shock protein HslJ